MVQRPGCGAVAAQARSAWLVASASSASNANPAFADRACLGIALADPSDCIHRPSGCRSPNAATKTATLAAGRLWNDRSVAPRPGQVVHLVPVAGDPVAA